MSISSPGLRDRRCSHKHFRNRSQDIRNGGPRGRLPLRCQGHGCETVSQASPRPAGRAALPGFSRGSRSRAQGYRPVEIRDHIRGRGGNRQPSVYAPVARELKRPHEGQAGPQTTRPGPDPAPVGPPLALSDPERFVILLTTEQLWRSIPAGARPAAQRARQGRVPRRWDDRTRRQFSRVWRRVRLGAARLPVARLSHSATCGNTPLQDDGTMSALRKSPDVMQASG